MFSSLGKNSTLYILDKNTKPTLRVGKVSEAKINPQFYGLTNQEIDITAEANGDSYEFKKIPANLSIVSPSTGIVISDNTEDMMKEYEGLVTYSQQVLDSIEYHKSVIGSQDEIMAILDQRFAKEREQENKLNALEGRIGNMEKGIGDIRTMLAQMINKTQGD